MTTSICMNNTGTIVIVTVFSSYVYLRDFIQFLFQSAE